MKAVILASIVAFTLSSFSAAHAEDVLGESFIGTNTAGVSPLVNDVLNALDPDEIALYADVTIADGNLEELCRDTGSKFADVIYFKLSSSIPFGINDACRNYNGAWGISGDGTAACNKRCTENLNGACSEQCDSTCVKDVTNKCIANKGR